MSKAIMLSIQPKWCELIASGEKTIEVRKTRPKIETPFKCYIYQTKAKAYFDKRLGYSCENLSFVNGKPLYHQKIIGEFVCDRIDKYYGRLTTYTETPYKNKYISPEELALTCLSIGEINDYLNGRNAYLWHISDLKIYDNPKELGEFCKGEVQYGKRVYEYDNPLKRPFQSWGYVEEF